MSQDAHPSAPDGMGRDGDRPAVEAKGLRLSHGSHVAVADGSFSLPTGVSVAVIGPNGSGKSTLLDAIAGLLVPSGGELHVMSRSKDRTGAGIAYVPQRTEVPSHLPLTVREVVTMGRYSRTGLIRPLGREGRDAVDTAMRRVDVLGLAERQVLELSGGQRQRVLVAQGLAASAGLLLMDEPMTGLDMVSAEEIGRVITEESASGATVVFSTHDLGDAAAADLVILLAGTVVACGPPAEVLVPDNLTNAYRGRIVAVGGVSVLDDPHHHGPRSDRHDGHEHG